MNPIPPDRRQLLTCAGAAALAGVSSGAEPQHGPRGKAEACIFIWLGGGMAQIDAFDPKTVGDAKAKKAGSAYESIPTAVDGVRVCKYLRKTAEEMDRVTGVRTVNHDVIDEHAAATHRVHTGRPTAGTIQYPSIGSVVAHERGAGADGVPAYVLIGYPNPSRGPGFLGPKAGYVYLTDTQAGPTGWRAPRTFRTSARATASGSWPSCARPGAPRSRSRGTTPRWARVCGWPGRSSCACST